MNTKKVCQQIGVTPKMLRVYEEAGLVLPKRKENDYRDYSMDDLFRIEITIRLRKLGFSIKEIQKIFTLEGLKGMEESCLNLFYIQIKAAESRINELLEIKEKLKGTINEIINVKNEENIMEIIHEMPVDEAGQNAYDSLIKAWDFDNMAVDYIDRFFKEDEDYKRGIDKCRSIISSQAKNKRIIDIGCGTCNLWGECDEEYDLVALDSSLNMLTTAQQKVPWAKFYLEDINYIDEEMFSGFDYVVSTFTLHHIKEENQRKTLTNMINLCNDYGKVVIVDKFFMSKEDRAEREKKLEKEGAIDALSIIKSEQPLCIDELERFISYMDCVLEFSRVTDNIGCFIITGK